MNSRSGNRGEVAKLFHEDEGRNHLFGNLDDLCVNFAKHRLYCGSYKLSKIGENLARRCGMELL